MKKLPKYILIMKIGPFSGFSLEEIIDIKVREEKKIGKFYLGYSGVFCHPKRVQEFIELARNDGETVTVLFTKTPSNFHSPIEHLEHYSNDQRNWQPLGKHVLLVGSKFSIVAKNLKEANFQIDLSNYRSMLGTLRGKTLDEQLRYRCDKACAIHTPSKKCPMLREIHYTCELTDEGCVYVK